MTSEKKYYQPTVDEFHVGFEFESHIDSGLIPRPLYKEGQEWKATVWQEGDFFRIYKSKEARVKHLDHEDIKSLGWENEHKNDKNNFEYKARPAKDVGSPIYLSLLGDNVHIQAVYSDQYTLFNGQVKNKSELKRLMAQLGII